MIDEIKAAIPAEGIKMAKLFSRFSSRVGKGVELFNSLLQVVGVQDRRRFGVIIQRREPFFAGGSPERSEAVQLLSDALSAALAAA